MDPLAFDDNVLCCTVMRGKSLREYCEAAGKAGFSAASIAINDYKDARKSGMSDADIRALFADNGLRIAELECIFDWIKPLPRSNGSGFSLDLPIFGHAQHEFFAIGEAIGAPSVTVVDPFPSNEPLDRMVESFAHICDRAAECGMRVHLEFLSWPPVSDLAMGWDIVRMADRLNGGLTIDTLHLTRSASREFLRSIPGDKIFTTQFCDGKLERSGDAFADSANREMLCEGEFGLPSILHDLRMMGCPAPLGFEVICPDFFAMPANEIAKRSFESVMRLRAEAAALDKAESIRQQNIQQPF